eukprot:TRINITY_DN3869_c0_g1_i2.p1 TRINITY_DN3869_c0_g1~~TRINITY_DN3869_c0_g1_i2.p1  ORF type:complete len:468 (+),score=103.22 TRINITY_DN3869_c0_g1_i2:25-1428(+)
MDNKYDPVEERQSLDIEDGESNNDVIDYQPNGKRNLILQAVFSLLLFVGLVAAILLVETTVFPVADTVLYNGVVYTPGTVILNGENNNNTLLANYSQGVAIKDGVLISVGENSEVIKYIGPNTKVVDLNGYLVLPGFIDTHVHPISGAINRLDGCPLYDIPDQQQILKKIKDYVDLNPDESWIIGSGWNLAIFPDANPSKDLLDPIIPNKPAMFIAFDGHSIWVNSFALQLANITKDTPNPPAGEIERDAEGNPTGTLRETAIDLVYNLRPAYTQQHLNELLGKAAKLANEYGVTTLHDADATDREINTYISYQDQLTVRVTLSMYWNISEGISQIPKLIEKYHLINNTTKINALGVKLYADGVLEAQTAYLILPYININQTNYTGAPTFTQQELNDIVLDFDKSKINVHVHAIGDGGIRMTLDSFQLALTTNGKWDSRHSIAHLELMDPNDIPRYTNVLVFFVYIV